VYLLLCLFALDNPANRGYQMCVLVPFDFKLISVLEALAYTNLMLYNAHVAMLQMES